MKLQLGLGLICLYVNFNAIAQPGRILFPKKDHFITTDSLFELAPQVVDFDLVSFKLLNKPKGSFFNARRGTFSWQPTRDDLGAHFLTFIASDTAGVEISQVIYVKVAEPEYPPVISFIEKNFSEYAQVIPVRERLDTIRFKVRATDRNVDDEVRYQFKINGRPTPFLENCTLEILEETLFFNWVPSNEAAKQKSFHFEVAAFDNIGLNHTLSLSFLVEDFNFPPEILNQQLKYEILPGQTTGIKIRARDWDEDELEFRLVTTGLSSAFFQLDSRTGYLTVNIPPKEIQNVINGSLLLTVRAQEVNDLSKYADITFELKQAAINIAPEVVISKKVFEVAEGRSFNYAFSIFDANGNQNLKSELKNAPEGLTIQNKEDNWLELVWNVDFDYLKTHARGEDKRTFETELIATDGLLTSNPVKLYFTVINQEDPEILEAELFSWKTEASKFISSMNTKSNKLDKKAGDRRKSNKWLGFLAASVSAFGGLSAATKDGSILNNAAPFWVFSSAVVSGYVALRTPPSEFSLVSNELKRMQTELKSTQDALDRLASERLDKAFRSELGKAVDQLKKSTNAWIIQFYPKYAELLDLRQPESEFSNNSQIPTTLTSNP